MAIPQPNSNTSAYKKHAKQLKKDEIILTEAPFYTIQGEGFYSGSAAFFIRFSYCSLSCHFCDTISDWDVNKKVFSYKKILEELNKNEKCKLVVLTGGESLLQLSSSFLNFLKDNEYQINIETSGSYWNESIRLVDYVCVSPKRLSDQNFFQGKEDKYIYSKKFNSVVNELKFIVDAKTDKAMIMDFLAENNFLEKAYFDKMKIYLSPMDSYNKEENSKNMQKLLELVLSEPNLFTVSLQTHKLLGVK